MQGECHDRMNRPGPSRAAGRQEPLLFLGDVIGCDVDEEQRAKDRLSSTSTAASAAPRIADPPSTRCYKTRDAVGSTSWCAGRLDRLGRNLKHLVTLLEELQALGVAFVSLCRLRLLERIAPVEPRGAISAHTEL